ncbi:manganese superoxide dismutase [Xylaria arbuscula]|nr:manganese superoxide dismutase [Xylaria arbuscula]
MAPLVYQVPPLKYAYDALEPHISKQIMELHHDKHHQAYVDNLNKALKRSAEAADAGRLHDAAADTAMIRFNGGGHINHSLLWETLSPASSPDAQPSAAPKLMAAINDTWGSYDKFIAAFSKALLALQGSGWGWLVHEPETKQLRIITLANQEAVVQGETPLIGVDMWEHAYYLQYLNGKAAYVENIWKVTNWKTAEKRFTDGQDNTFKQALLSYP